MYRGYLDLEYIDKNEEQLFKQTTRISGHHSGMVKAFYPLQAYEMLMGPNWNKKEPKGRGTVGIWGMALRYATINEEYREYAIAKGRFTGMEVDTWFREWGSMALAAMPLTPEEILAWWRENRKDRKRQEADNESKRARRRAKSFERRFAAERDPDRIYASWKRTIPSTSAVDEALLRQLARMLAESNDLLWQAERFKDDDGVVDPGNIQDYSKLLDLSMKQSKQLVDLMKQHGYDYQARRRRKESLTAAEIFEDFKEGAASLFDSRAIEIICPNCSLGLGHFIRNFPTVQYLFNVPKCPRCGKKVKEELEALPDEVLNE